MKTQKLKVNSWKMPAYLLYLTPMMLFTGFVPECGGTVVRLSYINRKCHLFSG